MHFTDRKDHSGPPVSIPDRDEAKNPIPDEIGTERVGSSAEDKRVAARRRFFKVGAGGSTAVVMTIAHRRAFAGILKGQMVSNCVSMQGVLDLQGMNKQDPLLLSPMGTPQAVVCKPRGTEANLCNDYQTGQYYNAQGDQVAVIVEGEIAGGCGNLEDTLLYQSDFRLYEKGYCPVQVLPNGDLDYNRDAVYYEKFVNAASNNEQSVIADAVTLVERKCQ
jgi:hypothetical protein